jgi:hypothetical protein
VLDDQTQLLRAREAALAKYADLTDPAVVAAHFDAIVEEFAEAPIRTYVPVLAERRLREVLVPKQTA